MKSLLARRNLFLVLAALAVLALVLLAAGLHDVSFAEPVFYSQAQTELPLIPVSTLLDQVAAVPLWKLIVFWAAVFLLVILAASLITPEMRKRLLMAFLRLTLIVLAVIYILRNRSLFGFLNSNPLSAGEQASSAPPVGLTPPTFVTPNVPPALTYLVSVAVILLTFGLLLWLRRGWLASRTPPTKSAETIDALAAAARSSLRDLSEGRDWQDAILNCYARMTDAVSRRRGLVRDTSMTTTEFALRLEQAGLPAQAVQRLTRLFEAVRYGARTSGTQESAEAADCLREVLHYCGESA